MKIPNSLIIFKGEIRVLAPGVHVRRRDFRGGRADVTSARDRWPSAPAVHPRSARLDYYGMLLAHTRISKTLFQTKTLV